MKVALIQLTNKHTEIFGTFIEYFQYKNIDVKIFYQVEKDNYSFLPYYFTLFKPIPIYHPNNLLNEDFDYYIFTSSQDKNRIPDIYKTKLKKKCIYIQHLKGHKEDFMEKNIKVSPLIDLSVPYVMPTYLHFKKLHSTFYKNNFAVIGAVRPNMIDKDLTLLEDLIVKNNCKIYFFMRKWDFVYAQRRFSFLRSPKIKCYSGLKTEDMIEKLKKMKFILPLCRYGGWFHKERLTGAIPLALNFNIPMVMDKRVAKIYGIENCGLLYHKKMIEVLDEMLHVKKAQYYEWIKNIAVFRKEQFKKNRKELDKIFT